MGIRKTKLITAMFFLLVSIPTVSQAQQLLPREKVPAQTKWNTQDLYPNLQTWEGDLGQLNQEISDLASCKGKLSENDVFFASCLKQYFSIKKRLAKIVTYANLVHYQNQLDVAGQELHQRAERAEGIVNTTLSFVAPEILSIKPAQLRNLLNTKALSPYKQFIRSIVGERKHVLSPIAEETIARSSDLSNLPENVYMAISTVNAPSPVVTLSDGNEVEITRTAYIRYCSSPVRADRLLVFQAFWNTYKSFRETYANLLSGVVSRDHYYAKVRSYKSDLEAALDRDQVPIKAYTRMIQQVRKNLPLLWRYLKLRKKLLGLAELGYHDLYTSIVPSVSVRYDWKETQKVLLDSLAPMGKEYTDVIRKAFAERWTDVYPTQGKRPNGDSYNDAYDTHPYILLNHNDDYLSLSMAAHEFGNAAHAYLSNKSQPFQTAKPADLVALVAAHVNENLLRLHLLKTAQDTPTKLFMLGQSLEIWRQAVYRQALFAEFELKVHQLAESGRPLTADRLDAIYYKLLQDYYGAKKGISTIDPLYSIEWAYISHIYKNFFVYQYTLSQIAGAAIAEKILAGDKEVRNAYLTMLKSGGSKNPSELLQLAHIDLSKPRPYQVAFQSLKKNLDEVDRLILQKKKTKSLTSGLTRDQVRKKDKWNLADLYPSVGAWNKDMRRLVAETKSFLRCKGKLSASPNRLAGCLDQMFSINKRLTRLDVYASLIHDQDAKDIQGQELHGRISKTSTDVDALLAFVKPEILSIDQKRMNQFLQHKKLKVYRHYLDNLTRLRNHVLSPLEEEIVARAGDLTKLPQDVYMTVSTLNVPFPVVTLKNGQRIKMTQSMYSRYRATADREDRINVFQSFWNTYRRYRETYANLLAGVVNRNLYIAKVRKYDSALQSSLTRDNIPVAIYHKMIEKVRQARPLLWRYLKLRKKLLNISDLAYHDLYTSIVPSQKLHFDYAKAKEFILASVVPLGKDYVGIIQKAFNDRWTDVYPTRNKRSGAYMSGQAYDVHPFVLLNYNDDYNSMSTTAHEFGHAAHSYLTNKTQPYHNSNYAIFVAEVASTMNEKLLFDYMIKQENDKMRKLSLLGQYLDDWRQTVFRQALFAEFELKMHELAQKGIPLTADLLDKTYLQLLRDYYGHDRGVCQIDPLYAVEWAYIPHLYYNFYVFQYTTSFIASTAIERSIMAGGQATTKAYLKMLRAGGSLYPPEVLRIAGVDLLQDKPYELAFESLKNALDQAEALVPN